ncbi:MAG: glycosyl transferase [Anaerolineales bacterium]|nr:glycosyl transferase [Anaerolineales bacterium]
MKGKKQSNILRNPYGYFDSKNREYVVTRPDTPTPWINYLGEGRYGGIISNTAGGFSFDRDPRNRRVTRYRYNAVPADQPGRYLYIRDMQDGEFWSPTVQPVPNRKYASYECRHGAGYTRISSSCKGIAASILYFVPPAPPEEACPCELWVLALRNTTKRKRTLRTFSYAEYSLWDAVTDQQNIDWGQQIFFSEHSRGILTARTKFRPTATWAASAPRASGFDTDREEFVGRMRSLSNPQTVERGRPGNSLAPRGNNIGSLSHLITLKPGEEKTLVYMLGVTDAPERIPAQFKRFRDPNQVQVAFAALRADWDAYLSSFTAATPDPEANAMLNVWNPIQCRANLYWSRFVSAYDTGLGRGLGTRDTAQDTLGVVHNLPRQARSMLTMIWKLQFRDGHAWHQVFPLTGEGGPGLAAEYPERPQWFSDDHLWLIVATCAYLRETGDFGYLREKISYYDGGADAVWEHMLRAADFTLRNRGPHRLPRLGFADWDDTMNLDHGSGKAESVFAAGLFCRAMLDLADLGRHLGKETDADRFERLQREMAKAVRQHCWDGEWYVRAYDDRGLPVGAAAEEKHKIGLNPQTWAVIGEIGAPDRQATAMESAHQKLNTPYGLRVMWPPYDGAQVRIGGTTTYPPGVKENGGIFNHANTWAIIAAAKLGWGDRAWQYYRQILPLARKDVDVLGTEPYVYCQNIAAPEHKHYGRGRTSWLTGTASYTYVAATQWILGIRPTFRGLRIAPVIPQTWTGFSVRRVFRGSTYQIEAKRAGKGSRISLEADGKKLEGNVVPLPVTAGGTVEVKLTIGE